MQNTTTCLILGQDTPDDAIASYAAETPRTNTHLRCLLIGPSPILSTYIYSVPPYGIPTVPDDWGDTIAKANKAHAERATEVSDILTKNGAAGDVTGTLCTPNDVGYIVARHARAADIATIASDVRADDAIFRGVAQGVLLHSPIGLVLNTSPASPFGKIFVAWDTSKAAARAVHAALPYLKAAEEVIIGCFDPDLTRTEEGIDPGTDISAWLSHHGCNVVLSQYPNGGLEIGQAIQDRATEIGSDLIVMGAYGHSRMREAVFSGTTRTLLEQTKLPVFMAH